MGLGSTRITDGSIGGIDGGNRGYKGANGGLGGSIVAMGYKKALTGYGMCGVQKGPQRADMMNYMDVQASKD